jgi:hypothetical protein
MSMCKHGEKLSEMTRQQARDRVAELTEGGMPASLWPKEAREIWNALKRWDSPFAPEAAG